MLPLTGDVPVTFLDRGACHCNWRYPVRGSPEEGFFGGLWISAFQIIGALHVKGMLFPGTALREFPKCHPEDGTQSGGKR